MRFPHGVVNGSILRSAAQTLACLAIVIALWEALARFALPSGLMLAPPSRIAVQIALDHALYARAFAVTLREACLGYLIGNAAAIGLVSILVLVPILSRPVHTVALVVFCLPLVATGPILRALLGPGEGPQVTLSALGVYYTTFLLLATGVKATPSVWLDLIASYGRGRWRTLVHVRTPASLPYLWTGLQIAMPAALLGAMVGEFTGADQGAGVLTLQAMRALDPDRTWALGVLASLIALAGYALVGLLRSKVSTGAPPLLLATPGGPEGGRYASTLAAVLGMVAGAIFVFLLWQGSMDAGHLSRFLAKRPVDVLRYLTSGPHARTHRDQLLGALGQTSLVALPGYLAGLVLGASAAVAAHLAPAAARVATPLALALRSIPIVVTAPLIVLAFGRGAAGVIVVVAVMTFFPTFVACLTGLKRTPGQVSDVFAVSGAGPLRTLLLANVPAMTPSFLAAAKMAVPSAVLAVTLTEWLATGTGVGNLMALASSTSKFSMLWCGVVALTGLCVLAYGAVSLAERWALIRFAPEQVAA